MIRCDLNDTEFKIISNIVDSTNEDYINKIINKLGKGKDLPLYQKGRGLPIGYEKYFIMQSKDVMYR